MKIFLRTFRVFLVYLLSFQFLLAQESNQNYIDYIKTYHSLAIKLMHKYKIPASITLSQGLLESGAGKSLFVKETNNHFGIKCHSDWTGKSYYHSDNKQNECFRKYKKAKDSFEDHSLFLHKERYSPLFILDIKDYTGWAKGLQRCGYATDKLYANKLIKLIENYKLYQFDRKEKNIRTTQKIKSSFPRFFQHTLHTNQDGLSYIIAKEGDTYEKIAKDVDIKTKKLIKYNEVPENFPIYKGDIIYLERKKTKTNKPYFEHIVQIGESMHKISQIHGIRIKNLYKLNKKDFNYIPTEGDILRLR